MKHFKFIPLLACVFVLSSCYHAKITTGKAPSNQVIDKPWAHSFIFGLVPPSVVEAANECENGVAMAETKISFLNGLVSAITFSIYTPMHITVTCAADSDMSFLRDEELIIPASADARGLTDAFTEASVKAFATGDAIFVKID